MVTGDKLCYPMDMAARIMYGAVVEFDSSYSKTSLEEINIILDNEKDKAIKTYGRLFKSQDRETRNKRIFLEDGTIFTKPYKESKYRMAKDGCTIGPIQLQVQIGDLLNCTADAIVVEVGGNIASKENVLHNDGVMKTESVGCKAENEIHILFEDTLADWRSKLVDCLVEAGKKNIKSVALPVVGSRATFSPNGIGACLFAAIDDFASQNPKSSVTDVRLVVPDSNARCVPAIIAALQARTTAVNFCWGMGKLFKSQLGCVADSNQFDESSIIVYSDATINIDRCIKALDDRIGLEFATKVVDADMEFIRCFSVLEINSFVDSDILVDVKFEKEASRFTIVGPLRNVLAALSCLHIKMRQYNSAKGLYDQTKWHWQCEDRLEFEKEVPYDVMPNFVIETAYREGKQTVELLSKDGKIYVIDFQKLVEYPKINIKDTVNVIRKDIIKDIKKPMPVIRVLAANVGHRVTLPHGVNYQNIEKRFLEEVKQGLHESKVTTNQFVHVLEIERIRNRTLYQQYEAKKRQMTREKLGCKQLKRKLWHGTSEESIPRIVNNGFNRSYCDVHEIMYGQGVNFAKDAFYAVRSNRAKNMPGEKRYMFLANVLTGELIEGNPFMRILPPVDPAEPKITYDCAVDDVNIPMQFVIFHDKQAFPKYLITYTSE